MPKYRFAWSNLPPRLLLQVAQALTLGGDPAQSLRDRFGARPKPVFIQQAWPTLLDVWLPYDSKARQAIVHDLRAIGLGKAEMGVSSKLDQLAYLRSCRNAPTLRERVLVRFLAAGEEAQIATPPVRTLPSVIHEPPTVPLADADDTSTIDRETARSLPRETGEGLDDWIAATLKEAYDLPEIYRDGDGDIPLPRGSSVLFINPHEPDSPFIQIFAPLLNGFVMSPEVNEAVNEINLQIPVAKATVTGDGAAIILSAQLLVDTLSAKQFLFVIDLVSSIADHFDTLLQKRFGGNTMMNDDEDAIDV